MFYLTWDLVIVPGYVLLHTIQMTTNQLSDSLASRNQVDMNVEVSRTERGTGVAGEYF
jgi:hypothetical protein